MGDAEARLFGRERRFGGRDASDSDDGALSPLSASRL
jgi:hypothetical protein